MNWPTEHTLKRYRTCAREMQAPANDEYDSNTAFLLWTLKDIAESQETGRG